MEKSLLDLLNREKVSVWNVNGLESKIETYRMEIVRLQENYEPSEWRDSDMARLEEKISSFIDEMVAERSRLKDIRSEIREYLQEVLK